MPEKLLYCIGVKGASSETKHTQLPSELVGFEKYMQGTEFARAISQLKNLISHGTTCLMRTYPGAIMSYCDMIVDYLVLQGMNVIYINVHGVQVEHILSDSARRESAMLIYDRAIKN